MNLQKQLEAVLATLKAKRNDIATIMTKAYDHGRTPDDDEESQIAAAEADIAKLEKNADRLRGLIKAAQTDATPVAGDTPEESEATAEGNPEPKKGLEMTQNLEKGIGFAQMAKAKALSARMAKQGSYVTPADIAKSQGMHPLVVDALEKSAQVMTTENAKPLVPVTQFTGDFIELLRAKTIVDKLANHMRVAPPNTTIAGMATGATSQWVGEGAKKPVTNATFNTVEIKSHKLAGIAILTDELLKRNSYNADKMVLNDLIESASQLIDSTFIDDQAQTAVRPAGILENATKVDSTGNDATAINADLTKLRIGFISKNLSLDGAYYIMSESRACLWAELKNPLGAPEFPGLQEKTGQKTLNGLPVIESETAGDVVILVKPSELYLADEGGVEIAYSDQATIDVNGTPVNLWQENKFAIRAERYITWAKRRPIAASYIKYAG